ncbi:hypothetical protein HQN89_25195 [Paenibacillus frigoriresistens]|uniref:hypothetical protein n=1 Tax=Paenibacillus alginolyticus TaxID=59839 RepID=UPI001563C997|nr:hypothetical protein [Paenibacillus frigoriresistens]NRF94217.1 hypothetical protein [Paenibacillus frigoriresistens]
MQQKEKIPLDESALVWGLQGTDKQQMLSYSSIAETLQSVKWAMVIRLFLMEKLIYVVYLRGSTMRNKLAEVYAKDLKRAPDLYPYYIDVKIRKKRSSINTMCWSRVSKRDIIARANKALQYMVDNCDNRSLTARIT